MLLQITRFLTPGELDPVGVGLSRLFLAAALCVLMVGADALFVSAHGACDIEKEARDSKQRIDAMQREAFRSDRAYVAAIRGKIKILASLTGWKKDQSERVFNNLLFKVTRLMSASRIAALSQRAETLALAKSKDEAVCEKFGELEAAFRQLDQNNAESWKRMLRFLDDQIAREKARKGL